MEVYDWISADTLGPGDRIRVDGEDFLVIDVEDEEFVYVTVEPLSSTDGEDEFVFDADEIVSLVR